VQREAAFLKRVFAILICARAVSVKGYAEGMDTQFWASICPFCL